VRETHLDTEERDAFLADLRLGVLCTVSPSGAPVGIPVWYGWNGARVEMYSVRDSAEMRQLERDARASVLVTHIPPEPRCWVSLEGQVRISAELGQETAGRLARRYMVHATELEKGATLRSLQRLDLVRLTLEPEHIRSYAQVGGVENG
jgi:nitroimidazol reductase NimA-like FMN-containing flavoprotein (pyridoxamine 5'-phosphate oxidase superfamily)